MERKERCGCGIDTIERIRVQFMYDNRQRTTHYKVMIITIIETMNHYMWGYKEVIPPYVGVNKGCAKPGQNMCKIKSSLPQARREREKGNSGGDTLRERVYVISHLTTYCTDNLYKICYNGYMDELEIIEVEYPLTSNSGKAYREYIDEDGELVHEFEESGVVRRASDLKIKRGFIRKDNAKALQRMGVEERKRRAVDAARDGLLRGVSAVSLAKDWQMAWEAIIAAQAELAMAVDMGSSSTKAAEFIAKMADLDPSKHKESITLKDGDKTISLGEVSPDRLDELLDALSG